METHTYPHLTLNRNGVRANLHAATHVRFRMGTLRNHWKTCIFTLPPAILPVGSQAGLGPDTKILYLIKNLEKTLENDAFPDLTLNTSGVRAGADGQGRAGRGRESENAQRGNVEKPMEILMFSSNPQEFTAGWQS